jgi:uncharacterized protein YabE (DUF348 family)
VLRKSLSASKLSIGITGITLAALVAGGGAWAATQNAVTVRIDGASRTIHTHADDVRGVLDAAGVKVGSRDIVLPGLESDVRDGDTVELDRARKIRVTIDGQTREVWTTAPTVGEALDQLAVGGRELKLSADRSSRLPLNGGSLQVATEKQVTLKADGRATPVGTYAVTVADLLAQQHVTVDTDDKVSPAPTTPLGAGTPTVVVQRITTRSATQMVTVQAPVSVRSDSSMARGERKVLSEGQDGQVRQVVRLVYTDGKLTSRQVLTKTVLKAAKASVVAKGTKQTVSSSSTASIPTSGSGLNWAALAQCESGGRTNAVSPGGTYYGLYQFSTSTWAAMGGSGLPSNASASEQTMRAQKLYARSGAGQWPVCGSRLFS